MRELHSLEVVADICGVSSGPPVFFNALRQGGTDSTWLWNLVMKTIIIKATDRWQSVGGCLTLDCGRNYDHIVWADNVRLFAVSRTALSSKIQIFTDVMAEHGLFWKTESLAVLS